MSKVRVCIEVRERLLDGYQTEARRRGVPVEELLARTVERLLEEMLEDEDRMPDAPFVMP